MNVPRFSERRNNRQVLWADADRVFCRVRQSRGSDSVLIVQTTAANPSADTILRLAHEFELKEQLNGTWAVRPVDLIRGEDRTVLVLEDPGGEPLEQVIGAPMEMGTVLHVAIGIAEALGKIHQRGFVHKDLKPAHILVNCADGLLRLTGFGIASELPRERQSPAPPETIAGTLAYMAPEQTGRMNRSIDFRSDLYSFGVVLYQMLTGVLPFCAADPMEWVHCHVARKPMAPSAREGTISPVVSEIVMKLLAKTPEERYQTAAGVERDLRRCLTDWQRQRHIEVFTLGEHDTPDRLLIPNKLYGRQREIDALVTAFDRVVAKGTPQLVLVSGYSGIGKSAIANELQKVLVPLRALFASGKFDQYKRDIPYSTLLPAFRDLVRRLLTLGETELAIWRDAFMVALKPNARLVTDLLPELKLVIGNQPPVPELDLHQAQRRFQLAFRRFAGVFARQERPLVLFFDDLQWLDTATLDLLQEFLTCPDLKYLMIIGAYRSNEVDINHLLMNKLHAVRKMGAAIDEIPLLPLTREHVERLIAEALHATPERVSPLAQLVHDKTGGNPFFIIQFLHALVDEDLLTFDHDMACWQWRLPDIRAKGYTDNVADLMVVKLTRLPAETRRALRLLACLGNTAAIGILSKVLGKTKQSVRASLTPAVHKELVDDLGDAYRFAHDRVQEAAYSLIPDGLRPKVHLRIGRLLATQTPPEKREQAIFDIVSQLNRGAALVASQKERDQLAEFNLIAGQRAKASTAYESALTYLIMGAQLLADDCWERKHELIFTLELTRAECEFLTGRLSIAEQRLKMLSLRATRTVEQALVMCLQMDVYLTLDQSDRAVAVCLDHLRHIGIHWSAHPGEEDVQREYERIWSRLGGRTIEDLIDLPLMKDPDFLSTADVLSKLLRPAWFTDANLASLTICKAVSLSLEHGNCDASSFAYVMFARIAGPRFNDYQEGFKFGDLGYKLVEQRGLKRFEAVTYLCYALYVARWTKHMRMSNQVLDTAFKAANRTGDLPSAAYTCCHVISNLLFAGEPLSAVEHEVEQGLVFSEKTGFGMVVDNLITQLALIRMLRGSTLRFGRLDDGNFKELRVEQHLSGNPALATAACWYWIRKLQARYIAGNYTEAVDAARTAQRLLWTSSSHLEDCEYHFYSALARAAHCDHVPAGERQIYQDTVVAHHRQLKIWSKICPANFANRVALVGAEIARLENRDVDAMRLFEEAILSARANGFVHNEAIANELAFRFYSTRGFEKIACMYAKEARQAYQRWGAAGKVRQLDDLLPHLMGEELAPMPTTTIGAPIEQLDLATVIKVSQAISGEIVLDNLVDTVMRTAIEQAGAARGVLILPDVDKQWIAAEATTDGNMPRVQLCTMPINATLMPESLLYHVLRTGESVILDDAAEDPAFSTDPYIREHRVRSIVCLPLMNQAKLTGVLYLENNLITRAFAPARIAVLRLLASQAATSFENTRLYEDLTEREARIRRLVDANIIGVIVWNANGDILEANDAFLSMVGYEREDLVSGRIRWRDLTPQEWRETTEEALEQILHTGRVQPSEKEYIRKDGSRIPVMVGRVAFESSRKEGVAFVVDLSERKEVEHRLRESYEMLRELTSRRETAREEERKRIAREMHDELGQHLTALRLRLSALRMKLCIDCPELVDQTQALVSLVDQTMQVVRGVITSLRPAALDTGIVAALEWLAAEFNHNRRVTCRLLVHDENIAMDEDRAIVLFRLVQEALTNVSRHAEATRVVITLERTANAYLLQVSDDGQGFDVLAARKKSFGLVGMEERVLMLGGHIEIVSSPGTGTVIKASLPDS
ncbi:PAS sensor protein [Paraburkholderia piptadeniae]|uniref:AAA family ATPase n=2 Tax=Paraburkholderia TaxID=1822464 RepID=A0A7X1TKI4_9BURK|nr:MULTISPECIES: AAA family ATPase [Paraburkholderia]MPW22616.1 AAA family ATPase [Paraburkholderia franconis]SIT52172.1 PAS sensor protein [Paraburkholderia piptadeniae]